MNKVKDFKEALRKLTKVSELRKEASSFRDNASALRTEASNLRNKVSSHYEELSIMLKKTNEQYQAETNSKVEKKVQEVLSLSRQATIKDSEAINVEQCAKIREDQAIEIENKVINILSSEPEIPSDYSDEMREKTKELWSIAIACIKDSQKRDEDSRKRDEESRKRDEESRKRDEESQKRDKKSNKQYEELKDIFDCKENGKIIDNHKKAHIKNKKIHCYGFLIFLAIIGLYIVTNLLGFSLGIDTSKTTAKVLLGVTLVLLICLIIVTARRLHRINKAMHKMDALILRMNLSTDRDLGKPSRLDRELEMIYRILES